MLIVVGFFTRIAAFIASGEMAFAYFYQHWPPLGGGPSASFWPPPSDWEAIMASWQSCSASRSCCWPPRALAPFRWTPGADRGDNDGRRVEGSAGCAVDEQDVYSPPR